MQTTSGDSSAPLVRQFSFRDSGGVAGLRDSPGSASPDVGGTLSFGEVLAAAEDRHSV